MLVNTLAQIIGSVVLIAIVLPWFLIALAIISVVYWYMAIFYRTSARELKRLGESTRSSRLVSEFEYILDAILRSSLYSHFSESLAGLSTIRAYGETERFLKENFHRVDVENRYAISSCQSLLLVHQI
jgi:ABC-type multidrug transport system fused ATPase/permease subunit